MPTDMCNRCGKNKARYRNEISLPGYVYTVSEENPEEVKENHVNAYCSHYLCEVCQGELNRWLLGR